MKRTKPLMLSFLSIILFQVLFFSTLIFLYHIIQIAPPYIKPISYEYYKQLIELPFVPQDYFFTSLVLILNSLFLVCFVSMITYILVTRELRRAVGGKNFIFSILIGLLAYVICLLLIRFVAEHYRLYMVLIPNQILSLILLYYLTVIGLRKLFGKDADESEKQAEALGSSVSQDTAPIPEIPNLNRDPNFVQTGEPMEDQENTPS